MPTHSKIAHHLAADVRPIVMPGVSINIPLVELQIWRDNPREFYRLVVKYTQEQLEQIEKHNEQQLSLPARIREKRASSRARPRVNSKIPCLECPEPHLMFEPGGHGIGRHLRSAHKMEMEQYIAIHKNELERSVITGKRLPKEVVSA